MKHIKKYYTQIQFVLLLLPLIFLVIPSFFGYYLYSPLNYFAVIYGVWFIFLIINIFYPENRKKNFRVFIILTILSILPYTYLNIRGDIGESMEKRSIEDSKQFKEDQLASAFERAEESTELTGEQWTVRYEETECTIDFYRSPAVGGPIFSFGGGRVCRFKHSFL